MKREMGYYWVRLSDQRGWEVMLHNEHGEFLRCGIPTPWFEDEVLEVGEQVTHPAAERRVPDGWKLVPIEPTKEMLDAGRWWNLYEESSRSYAVDDDEVISTWTEMINAAPAPKGEEE